MGQPLLSFAQVPLKLHLALTIYGDDHLFAVLFSTHGYEPIGSLVLEEVIHSPSVLKAGTQLS